MRSIKSLWILGAAVVALAGMSLQAEAAPRGPGRGPDHGPGRDRHDKPRDHRWDRRDDRRDNRWDRPRGRKDNRWNRRDYRRPSPSRRYKSNNGNHYGYRNR